MTSTHSTEVANGLVDEDETLIEISRKFYVQTQDEPCARGTKVYAPGVGLIVDGPLDLISY